MKKLILVPLLLSALHLNAQNQAARWYFGQTAGMNFLQVPPAALQGTLSTTEGSTVSCDSAGNLNFYSDGVSVWDKNGTVMPNGSGLFGNVSTTVSALTVPHPGNGNLHYLFTLDEATGINGFCYSVVDMSLQQGNGDVTLKNVPLQGNVTEKMAAVQQLGTQNTWVTIHEWGTDAFYSYLVTTAGLQIPPVLSNAGMVHTIDALEQNKYGQMKFNTCGTKIALAIGYTDTVQVLDFNPATGIFSNPITLPLGDHVYGVEFSQEGNMLYVTRYNTGVGYADLVQYDLSSGNQSTILATQTIISSNTSGTNFYYAMQLGLDAKIYVCTSWSPFLGVVANPAASGAACNFNPMGFDLDPNFLGITSALGLPAFVQSYFRGEVQCSTTGLNEFHPGLISVYPTVSRQGFYVEFPSEKPVSVSVYDPAGRIIFHKENIRETGYYFGESLKQGNYFVRINEGASGTFRITKL